MVSYLSHYRKWNKSEKKKNSHPGFIERRHPEASALRSPKNRKMFLNVCAKGAVFWNRINQDIEKKVFKCAHSQKHQRSQVKEPLKHHDVPPHPWHPLGTDDFYWNQKYNFLVAEIYSKYPIVRRLNTISLNYVFTKIRTIFGEYSIPYRLVNNYGTH